MYFIFSLLFFFLRGDFSPQNRFTEPGTSGLPNLSELLKELLQKESGRRIRNFPVTPVTQYFLQSTAVQVGGVLQYKWEPYCSTNGRCTVGFPSLQGVEARKIQRYKWGEYCRTNWRCIRSHLGTLALKTEDFSERIGRFSKTQKWIY